MRPLNATETSAAADWFAQVLDYPGEGLVRPPAPPVVRIWLDDADTLAAARDRVAYCGLFDIGNPEPPVPLLESHYHRDPLARLRRVVNFYRAYGVVQDPHRAPDHLCVELSYLAYLARVAAMYPLRADLVDAVRAFARHHPASFVPRCARELHRSDQTGVYAAIFDALACFLADVGGATDIPVSVDPEDAPAMAAAQSNPHDN